MRPCLILSNREDGIAGGTPDDLVAAQSHAATVSAVAAALAKIGPVVEIDASDGDPDRLAREIRVHDPRLVFNLAEGARGRAEFEANIAALVELIGFPFTGNSMQTLALCLDKPTAQRVLRGAGIPVPDGAVLRNPRADPLDGVSYPAIVKPAALDASHGIEPASVVVDEAAARAKAAELMAIFPGRALVETFIDGREIAASVVQIAPDAVPAVLPLSEIDWPARPGEPRVLGFRAKWIEGSDAFEAIQIVCPAPLAASLRSEIEAVCRRTFVAVSARDYLRIDLRIDAGERVFVIDVNPNPCLAPDAGFARSALAAGWSYDAIIQQIARNAESRAR